MYETLNLGNLIAMTLKDIKVATKLNLLILASFLSLIFVCSLILFNYRVSLYDCRKEKIENLTEAAYSLVEASVNRYEKGEITEEEAKTQAKEAVKSLSFGGNNYFWINDYDAYIVMHPKKPQLDGKDLSDFKDPHGKRIFSEFARVAKAEGAAFVGYNWVDPSRGSSEPLPKISHVRAVPAWEWVIGAGIYLDDVDAYFYGQLKIVGVIIAIGFLIVGFLGWLIIKSLSVPILRISQGLAELSDDKLIEVKDDDRKDEIGDMAKALMELNVKLSDARDAARREQENKRQAEEERREMLLKMAEDFDAQVGSFIGSLASASTELQSSAEGMKSIAEQTSSSSDTVVSSSGEASANVNTVASAMEEMSASISEIVTQITSAKTQSNDTAINAESANVTVANLSELVKNIGEVVVSIQDIAEQTNLLALNATIEAARAGEAGKGFAVVAEEVKKLASETSQKTEEINVRITDIQNATAESVTAMERIIKNIGDIDTSVTGISAAAEEQNATTNEIVRSVAEASNGVQQVSYVILDVQKGASETRSSADAVLDASKEVAELSENLRGAVETFLGTIRDDANASSDDNAESESEEKA